MKTNNSVFNPNSEFRLIQRLDRLEITLYKIKCSILRWGIGIAFMLVVSEGGVYYLFH